MVKTYTSKQILEKVGISRATLYKWLKEGKVSDVCRDRNNFRIFTDEDIHRLLDYKNFIKKPPKRPLQKEWPHLRNI